MRFKSISLFCCWLLTSPMLFAHPHNWIDLKTEFELNKAGQLVSLEQYWLFDVDFSQLTIEDIFHESRVQPNSLQLLGDDMINNMQSFDYFSYLRIDNLPISLYRPSDYSLEIVEKDGQQQLFLRMKFVFKDALTIKGKQVVWQVYDPTYYIDMKHMQQTNVVVLSAFKTAQCEIQLKQPTPSKRLIDYVSGLDASKTDYNRDFSEQEADQSYLLDPLFDFQDRLGKEFAEKVVISCH